jgi:hypothetical protein
MKACLPSMLLACAGVAAGADRASGCIDSRPVPFDEFFNGRLGSVPLRLPVPSTYQAVAVDSKDDTLHYWFPPDQAEQVRRTGDLPAGSGYVYGRLSRDVGYHSEHRAFDIEGRERDLGQLGFTNVRMERARVNEHAVLFVEFVETKTGRKAYMAYVALNQGTAAAFVAFVPPGNVSLLGDCFWKYFKTVVKDSSRGAASP